MTYVIVDVEADGKIPPRHSMVCFGAVILDIKNEKIGPTFYGKTRPISEEFIPESLAISGFSREEHLQFNDPEQVMKEFKYWLKENIKGRPVFMSDNLAFDWSWINWYFHNFINDNPFGYSGRRIGDLYCGMKYDMGLNSEWKSLYRKTAHDHNPVNDAIGNGEAVLTFKRLGLKI